MMMIIAPNSLVREKEVHGDEKEETRDQRMGGQTEIPTPGSDALTGPSRSRVSDARNRKKNMGGGVKFYSTGGAEGAKD